MHISTVRFPSQATAELGGSARALGEVPGARYNYMEILGPEKTKDVVVATAMRPSTLVTSKTRKPQPRQVVGGANARVRTFRKHHESPGNAWALFNLPSRSSGGS